MKSEKSIQPFSGHFMLILSIAILIFSIINLKMQWLPIGVGIFGAVIGLFLLYGIYGYRGAILLTPSQSCNPVSGNLANSTTSTSTSCAVNNMDVWYKFVATTTDHLIKVTFPSPTLSFIDLRSGACAGTSIACSANNGSDVNTLAASGLTPGATYYIMLGTSYTIPTFTTCVSIPPPINDECSGAITLAPSTSCNPVNGTTISATQSIGAVTCGGNTGNADDDVWFKFNACD